MNLYNASEHEGMRRRLAANNDEYLPALRLAEWEYGLMNFVRSPEFVCTTTDRLSCFAITATRTPVGTRKLQKAWSKWAAQDVFDLLEKHPKAASAIGLDVEQSLISKYRAYCDGDDKEADLDITFAELHARVKYHPSRIATTVLGKRSAATKDE